MHKRDASWLKGNRHKIAHTHGSSLISTKKLVLMGKLLTRCCRMAVAKALKKIIMMRILARQDDLRYVIIKSKAASLIYISAHVIS
jgi:hypothetical protein